MTSLELIPGAAYEILFPFLITTYQPFPEGDGEGGLSYPAERETWRPGWEPFETQYTDGNGCHGWGHEVRKVVSVHKPGHYPERVFYVRSWVDPDGRAFGRGGLRMVSTQAFRRWATGRRYGHLFRTMQVWPRPTALALEGAA